MLLRMRCACAYIIIMACMFNTSLYLNVFTLMGQRTTNVTACSELQQKTCSLPFLLVHIATSQDNNQITC